MNVTTRIATAVAALAATTGIAFADGHMTNALETQPQELGQSVTVKSVTAAQDGWVVIHQVRDGAIVVPASIGHTYIKAGTTQDVHVALTAPLDSDRVIAMLHVDDGELGVYQFGPGSVEYDKPVMVDGHPVVSPIVVED